MIYVRSSAADFAPLLPALIFQIPLAIEFPGPPSEEASSYGLSKSKIRLTNLLTMLKTRCATVIVTVTEPIKRDISLNYRVHPNKIHVIQNAANTELFKPIARDDALKRLGLDVRKKYIGFVGNISPWHGVDILVKAGSEVLRSCPEVVFHIIGEGVMKARLEEEIEAVGLGGSFLFAGAVPYKQVPLYVSSCDLMALPLITKSAKDSGYSPLKLYEYMSCGKPTVASRLIGLEIVEDEGIGRLVAPNDASDLSSAIIAMISDPGALTGMGTRARLLATTKFDWQYVAERTEKLIVNSVR
jgi:glycosyltransferase involved in cell wall biosynthesis